MSRVNILVLLMLAQISIVLSQEVGFEENSSALVDYGYDYRGNEESNINKGISKIEYNQFDLPNRFYFGTDKFVEFIYDASGRKIQKRVVIKGQNSSNQISKSSDYVGNIIYDNTTYTKNVIVQFSKGRSIKTNNIFANEYYLKDYLGNNRLLISSNSSVKEVNHFYPFGMKMNIQNITSVLPINRFKYNSKEYHENEFSEQEALGLYHYGARFYDPEIGRWTTIDPATIEYPEMSVYNYVNNDPVYFVDPDGKRPDDFYLNLETGKVEYHAGLTGNQLKSKGMVWLANEAGDVQETALQIERSLKASGLQYWKTGKYTFKANTEKEYKGYLMYKTGVLMQWEFGGMLGGPIIESTYGAVRYLKGIGQVKWAKYKNKVAAARAAKELKMFYELKDKMFTRVESMLQVFWDRAGLERKMRQFKSKRMQRHANDIDEVEDANFFSNEAYKKWKIN